MKKALILALAPLATAAAPAPASLEIEVEGLRNARGVIHACLTQRQRDFPDCENDPQALTTTVSARAAALRFAGFAPGQYAVTLFHDENENARLDKLIGIPREGFGFSRNPAIRFGAPRFSQAEFGMSAGLTRQTIRMRYLL